MDKKEVAAILEEIAFLLWGWPGKTLLRCGPSATPGTATGGLGFLPDEPIKVLGFPY